MDKLEFTEEIKAVKVGNSIVADSGLRTQEITSTADFTNIWAIATLCRETLVRHRVNIFWIWVTSYGWRGDFKLLQDENREIILVSRVMLGRCG